MDRLEKLINILKLTPHYQPDLVKEAAQLILSRTQNVKKSSELLRPLIEILIQYCDNNDSAQRSLFNDYLNSVILKFQYDEYLTIFEALLDQVTNNGSARTVTTALQRISYLVQNVRPTHIGSDTRRLLKALIEISRRSDDELVLKSLDSVLNCVMPYMEYQIRNNSDMQMLSNSLVDILLRNLHHSSSQTKRLAATSLATLCSHCDILEHNIIGKLSKQLVSSELTDDPQAFIGFSYCIRSIKGLAEHNRTAIIEAIFDQIKRYMNDTPLVSACLELLKDLLNQTLEDELLERITKLLLEELLFEKKDGQYSSRVECKVIIRSNALACVTSIVQYRPDIIDSYHEFLKFDRDQDIAIKNQTITLIGRRIYSLFKFPDCIDSLIDLEKVRNLWVELQDIMNNENSNPDILKTCVTAVRISLPSLLESDHCLHIVDYSDINRLIRIYNESNFKPLKLELLGLFSSLNYRTLHYLEKSEWSRARASIASSMVNSLQDRIMNEVVFASLCDEHPRVRQAAMSALIQVLPNLFIVNRENNDTLRRSSDPVASLAQDLADKHLKVLRHAEETVHHFTSGIEPVNSVHDQICAKQNQTFLSSSIVPEFTCKLIEGQYRINLGMNLSYVVSTLFGYLREDCFERGKSHSSYIVQTLYNLSMEFPIQEFHVSWDCKPSEDCGSFRILDFLLTRMENLSEPDIIVEDLEAYKNFILLTTNLLCGLCYVSLLDSYKQQTMKTFLERQRSIRETDWSENTIKSPHISTCLDIYFTHLSKLLWLISSIIEGRSNPITTKQNQSFDGQDSLQQKILNPIFNLRHRMLTSDQLMVGRAYRKFESSYASSKRNLNQKVEKFHQIVETCLRSLSSLLEFVNMRRSYENFKTILSNLQITSTISSSASLACARQLLKSLFGINAIALYQADPYDWFEDFDFPDLTHESVQEQTKHLKQSVYHYLITNPDDIFAKFRSQWADFLGTLALKNNESLSSMHAEVRRALTVRRRIEHRVRSLFEGDIMTLSPQVRILTESLKNAIREFTPIVKSCMNQFDLRDFCDHQKEVVHFMSYLVLLKVDFKKLDNSERFIHSMKKLLEDCGARMFSRRANGIEDLIQHCFTLLTLLTYERGPNKPSFQIPEVIQMLDDMRAKLSMKPTTDIEIMKYIVPPLRCLIEDLFIYRASYFQINANRISKLPDKETLKLLEAARETVARKLIDLIQYPKTYEMLSILILESRLNSNGFKYRELSALISAKFMHSRRNIKFTDYQSIDLTIKIIENLSQEIFQPIEFVKHTLFDPSVQTSLIPENDSIRLSNENQRWMSLVIVGMHVLVTQVTDEADFIRRLESETSFVMNLLQIAQIGVAEIITQIKHCQADSTIFIEQLASYLFYLNFMFRGGFFNRLSKVATEFIKGQQDGESKVPAKFTDLCDWARKRENGFSIEACQTMFYQVRYILPDINIYWGYLMVALDYVNCNRGYWQKLLAYNETQCKLTATIDSVTVNCDQSDIDSMDSHQQPSGSGPRRSINIELARRGCLCHISDYFTDSDSDSISDVKFIHKIISNHINDIIKWTHEMPLTEFITFIHRKPASSGIFIQAIRIEFNEFDSMASLTRMLWTLKEVHYSHYGTLLILLVDKFITSDLITPYYSFTKRLEEFACETIKKLLNGTNKSLVATNEEIINQLTTEDIDKIYKKLPRKEHERLSESLIELRKFISGQPDISTLQLELTSNMSGEDSDQEVGPETELGLLNSIACMIFKLAQQKCSSRIATIIPALNRINNCLSSSSILMQINKDTPLACNLVTAIFCLVRLITSDYQSTSIRLTKPKCWIDKPGKLTLPLEVGSVPLIPSELSLGNCGKESVARNHPVHLLPVEGEISQELIVDGVRNACLRGMFLVDHTDDCQIKEYDNLPEIIVRLARLQIINSFILVPPKLWIEGLWPIKVSDDDPYRTNFPMVTHDVLLKDLQLVDNFCERLLKLGWTSRIQFEESWNALLGVLMQTLSNSVSDKSGTNNDADHDLDPKSNLETSCRLIISITKFLLLTNRTVVGDPLAPDSTPAITFNERVVELAKIIAPNLISLKREASNLIEKIVSNSEPRDNYNQNLKIPAQKLRFNAIEMQDSVVIESNDSSQTSVNVESLIKLLLDLYNQKIKNPNESLYEPTSDLKTDQSTSNLLTDQSMFLKGFKTNQAKPTQMAPPLATAICQSILALSDLFTEIEQFEWLFNTFIEMFKLAERNEDEVQLQYIIVGLCKSVAVCCFELPSEQATTTTINHRDIMFEKCRQSIEKCLKSSFGPLKYHTLCGVFYMLEDSLHIVASGAYDILDHFKLLRQARLNWILKLNSIILNKDNLKILTASQDTSRLLEALCKCVEDANNQQKGYDMKDTVGIR